MYFLLLSMQFLGRRKEMQPLWELLCNITIYYIWKASWSNIFHEARASLVEMVHNIWRDMMHTLKGQWGCLIGDSEAKVAQHHQFLTQWELLQLCPPKMVILFGTFSHQDACSLHRSLENRNYVNCFILMNEYLLQQRKKQKYAYVSKARLGI